MDITGQRTLQAPLKFKIVYLSKIYLINSQTSYKAHNGNTYLQSTLPLYTLWLSNVNPSHNHPQPTELIYTKPQSTWTWLESPPRRSWRDRGPHSISWPLRSESDVCASTPYPSSGKCSSKMGRSKSPLLYLSFRSPSNSCPSIPWRLERSESPPLTSALSSPSEWWSLPYERLGLDYS